MAIYYPPVFINAYLAEQIPARFNNEFSLPFFPTSPTDIGTLTQSFPDGFGVVYDRMLKMRRSPFPHIKSEQLLYYFYKMAGDPVALIEATQVVQDLLDREDESAQELNEWISAYQTANPGTPIPALDAKGNQILDWVEALDGQLVQVAKTRQTARIGDTDFLLPYFHKIRIYQLEETRDIVDFGTARTYAGNKIIVDYDWHKSE